MRFDRFILMVCAVTVVNDLVGANSFFEQERAFQADRKHFEDSFKKFYQVGAGVEGDKFTSMALQMSEEWAGKNEYYRLSVLNSAYWRLLESPAQKGTHFSNQVFLASQLILKLTNAPPDFSMTVMNNLWSTLTTQGLEENPEDWSTRRRENMEAWFGAADRAKAEFNPEFLGVYSLSNVSPPPGSKLSPGSGPEGEPNPVLREKYCESIQQNRLAHQAIQTARHISEELPRFEKRAESLAALLYSKPPYALLELQEILDRRVSDERATNIMNAVYRALPKAVAATLPRPIPHVAKPSENQAATGTAHSGLPAVARPNRVLEAIRKQQGGGTGSAVGSAAPGQGGQPSGVLAESGGGGAVWPWALLGLAGAAGGWVWLRLRRS